MPRSAALEGAQVVDGEELDLFVLRIEVVDCEPLPDEIVVQLHLAPDDIIKIAKHPWQKTGRIGVEDAQRRPSRRVVIHIVRNRTYRGRVVLFEERLGGRPYVADDQLGPLEPALQRGEIHFEESGLPVIRKIAVVLRRRQTRAGVEAIDLDLDGYQALDLRRMLLQRGQSGSPGDAELENAHARHLQSPRESGGLQHQISVVRTNQEIPVISKLIAAETSLSDELAQAIFY